MGRSWHRWLGKEPCCTESAEGFFEAEVHSYEKTVLNAFKEAKNAIVDFNKIKEVYQLRAKLGTLCQGICGFGQTW